MREILFRGKQVDNDEWVYGSFCMDAIEQKNGLCGVDGFIRLYDFAKGKMQMHEVDRETVGQFTGLTDKNGVKIFEGDLVKAERVVNGDEWFGSVVWWHGCFAIQGVTDRNVPAIDLFREYEVIGNLHDNPELLEVK